MYIYMYIYIYTHKYAVIRISDKKIAREETDW